MITNEDLTDICKRVAESKPPWNAKPTRYTRDCRSFTDELKAVRGGFEADAWNLKMLMLKDEEQLEADQSVEPTMHRESRLKYTRRLNAALYGPQENLPLMMDSPEPVIQIVVKKRFECGR